MSLLGDPTAAWPQLSRLLDEALSLPPPDREGWLQSLPAEHAPLKETLAKLLEVRAGIETGDFLGTLPKLDGASRGTPDGPEIGAPQAGDEVGPWRLIRELGEGGMGSVWLAERADGQLKRQVALKLPRLTWARGLAERMERERDILATLEHPRIARLYDAGVDPHGRPWLALEHVQGRPLDVHAREAGLDTPARVRLLLQVCEAVAYAHSRLVIHRDLKPANILVDQAGQVKLLDFGIAKILEGEVAAATALTELQGRALTLDYASPEQVRGEPLTTASDIYALGVVTFELLAGARPYKLRRGSAAELEEVIANAEVPLASAVATDRTLRKALRGDLDAIVNKALKKSVAERYRTVDALAQDLRRHLDGQAIGARPDAWIARWRSWLLRHRVPTGIGAAVLLALVGGAYAQVAVVLALAAGTALALWQRRQAQQHARRAVEQAAEARAQADRAERVKRYALSIFEHADTDAGAGVGTTAVEVLRRAGREIDASLQGDGTARIELKTALGSSLTGLAAYDEALGLLLPTLHEAERLLGPRDPLALAAGLALGEAQSRAQHLPEAIETLRRVSERAAPTSELRLRALCSLSTALIYAGQVDAGLDSAREAAAAAAAAQVDARARAKVAATLAQALAAGSYQGLLGAARQAHEAALTAYGDQRPAPLPLLEARVLVAQGLQVEGRWREAVQALEAALPAWVELLGESHPRVAQLLGDLGTDLYTCGDVQRALRHTERALAINAAAHGAESLAAARDHVMVGVCLHELWRVDEAIERLDRARRMLDAQPGAGHGYAQFANVTLCSALIRSGQLARAEALIPARAEEATLSLLERLRWEQRRGLLHAVRGQADEAVASGQRALEMQSGCPELSPIAQVNLQSATATVFLEGGAAAQALPLLRYVVERLGELHVEASPGRADARLRLGRALLEAGDAGAAVAPLTAALHTFAAIDPGHRHVRLARGLLAQAGQALGEPGVEHREAALRPLRGPP
ncbi:MAG: protein kinase domain-containing protein [Pseudomonadota bacterium]